MEIQSCVTNGVNVVDISGHLDTNSAPDAEQHLDKLLGQGGIRIVIDFKALEYISSAGLRVLLAISKKLKAQGGAIGICNLNEVVQEVFDISGFSTILKVYTSTDQAVENLQA